MFSEESPRCFTKRTSQKHSQKKKVVTPSCSEFFFLHEAEVCVKLDEDMPSGSFIQNLQAFEDELFVSIIVSFKYAFT